VIATDSDAGENSAIKYSLEGAAANQFQIDALTGVIKAMDSFDREKAEVLHITVVARDLGSPALSSSARVSVTIFDVNDVRPVFSPPAYSFAVPENQPEGSEVGTVVALDDDSSIYGDVCTPNHFCC